jgi:hypothetical protein
MPLLFKLKILKEKIMKRDLIENWVNTSEYIYPGGDMDDEEDIDFIL